MYLNFAIHIESLLIIQQILRTLWFFLIHQQLRQKLTQIKSSDQMEDVDRLFHWMMEVLPNVIPKQNITAAQNGVIVEAQMSIVIVQIVLIIVKMMHQVYNSCHLTIFLKCQLELHTN